MHEAQPLLIFPYNGNGLEALDCIGSAYQFIGFIDDTPEKLGIEPNGYRVMNRSALTDFSDAKVLAVPGSPTSYQSRKELIESLGIPKERFATVIHPSACISPLASIGSNVLIMAGVIVTSNAIVGSHTCILPNTVIHHDVALGEWSLVGSNVVIAGHTVIEENCYIGSASNIMNGLHVGSRSLIGFGSNVVKNVEANTRVVGNPARKI